MSDKYKILRGEGAYFVTFTIVGWIKVLDDDSYKQMIIDSIRFYQKNKDLIVYGYCIMPNHVHMIVQAKENYSVSEFLRDLKKYTSKSIINKLETEKPEGFSVILDQFRGAGKPLKRIKSFKVWQDGNMAKLLYSNKFFKQKLNYIHNNPVKYGLCNYPWDYLYSSATNYAEMDSIMDVELLSLT